MNNGYMYDPYSIGINPMSMPQNSMNMPNMPMRNNNNVQNNMYAYVNGIEGAKAYIVPPNTKMILMDSDNPIFYLKASNEFGQANIRTFKFEEVTGTETNNKTDYASIQAVQGLAERIKKLEEVISNGGNSGAIKENNTGAE